MSESIGSDLYDGRKGGSRPDLLNTGDGSLSRQTSRRDAAGTNAGYVTGGVSRQCYISPDLGPILSFSGIRLWVAKRDWIQAKPR